MLAHLNIILSQTHEGEKKILSFSRKSKCNAQWRHSGTRLREQGGQLISYNLPTYSCIFARWTISIYQWQDGTVPLATVYPHFTWKLCCPLILLIGSVFSHKTPNYLYLPNRKRCEALGSISDLKFPASHTNSRMELLASRFLHFKEMASVFFFR